MHSYHSLKGVKIQKLFNFLIVGLTFFALNVATVEAQLGGDKINRLESSTTGPSATGANLADTKIVDSSGGGANLSARDRAGVDAVADKGDACKAEV